MIKALKYIENDLCLKLLFYLSKNLIIKKKEILVSTVSTKDILIKSTFGLLPKEIPRAKKKTTEFRSGDK